MLVSATALALSCLVPATVPHAASASSAPAPSPHVLQEPSATGTGWLPGTADPYDRGFAVTAEGWLVRAQGEAVLRYTSVNFNNKSRWRGDSIRAGGLSDYPEFARGGRMIDVPNWAMVSAQRELPTGGTLRLRGVLSLDPATVGGAGYPLLYQSGGGLADRQHPQDFITELSALYSHPVGPQQRVFASAAMPGEPALGPGATRHRPSAGANPDASRGESLQDATHISHGVITAGYIFHRTKLDASLFRGREPDAQRWDLDFGLLDSWSVRLTQNVADVSLQASYARLNKPEPGERHAVHRVTASASRSRIYRPGNPLRHERTLAWGMNAGQGHGVAHSMLGEASLGGARWQLWNRWEALQRNGEELDLTGTDVDGQYWVYALTLGAGGTLFSVAGVDVFMGAQGSLGLHDPGLEPYYGSFPLSVQVFVKMSPASLLHKRARAAMRPPATPASSTP